MRRQVRTDGNHAAIVRAFRQIGASVQDLSSVGKGCPDLLVGYRNVSVPVEIKNGEKCESARQLTAAQRDWHAAWAGSVLIVDSVEDAVTKVIEFVMQNK